MSTANEIHAGDVGTRFAFTLTDCGSIVDISLATSLAICFSPPTSPDFTRAATFTSTVFGGVGDGSDGKGEYAVVPGDLGANQLDAAAVGEWSWQVTVILPSGEFRSNIKDFEVFENLDC